MAPLDADRLFVYFQRPDLATGYVEHARFGRDEVVNGFDPEYVLGVRDGVVFLAGSTRTLGERPLFAVKSGPGSSGRTRRRATSGGSCGGRRTRRARPEAAAAVDAFAVWAVRCRVMSMRRSCAGQVDHHDGASWPIHGGETPTIHNAVSMARLFIAVLPPDDVVELLRELPRKDQRGVRFVPPENWHATLRFLGDADIDEVAESLNRSSLPAAAARVGPAIDMLGTHSVIAPVGGLVHLARAVDHATEGLGTLEPRPTYRGHITVARVKRGAIVRKVVGMLCDASFDVGEVALVESRLRPEGSDYRTVATWPIGKGRHGPSA